MEKKSFVKDLLLIALPISIQALFQASLSVIDQFMVGKLGEESISAIAFGGKFSGILTFTIYAISGTASIMMAQYIGKKDPDGVKKSFALNSFLGGIVAFVFFILAFFGTNLVLKCYTNDNNVISLGEGYLRVVALSYLPILGASMINGYLQNNNKSYLTMIVGLLSVVLNTLLNWILIFGNDLVNPLGVFGAGLATMITQYTGFVLLIIFALFTSKKSDYKLSLNIKGINKPFIKKNMMIAAPFIFTEFMWSLGESVYSSIYGHMSTEAMAAMANIGPVISLTIGFFSGLAAATGILTGQKLGEKDGKMAYKYAKRFIATELIGSVLMGLLVILIAKPYSSIYNVSDESKQMTVRILYVYGIVLWAKVSNMVSGRIIQSGGKTTLNMIINLIGTWVFGIPLGFLAANIWNLSIEWVYLIISIEEIIRCILCFIIIKSKKWIRYIAEEAN